MSSPHHRQRHFSQLVTYQLTSNAPIEQVFRQEKIFHNLSKEIKFQQLCWGRWTEDNSCIDILISEFQILMMLLKESMLKAGSMERRYRHRENTSTSVTIERLFATRLCSNVDES